MGPFLERRGRCLGVLPERGRQEQRFQGYLHVPEAHKLFIRLGCPASIRVCEKLDD